MECICEEAWLAYYGGRDNLPDDGVGTVLTPLGKREIGRGVMPVFAKGSNLGPGGRPTIDFLTGCPCCVYGCLPARLEPVIERWSISPLGVVEPLSPVADLPTMARMGFRVQEICRGFVHAPGTPERELPDSLAERSTREAWASRSRVLDARRPAKGLDARRPAKGPDEGKPAKGPDEADEGKPAKGPAGTPAQGGA